MTLSIAEQIAFLNNWVGNYPEPILLVGGGLLLTLYVRFMPLAYFRHAIGIMQGKYDQKGEKGEISHYQALAGAISATVGMGNISGVAIAIATGGPGAIFWMWVCALLGMVTKFFECSLAIMYRKPDEEGNLQGGPMYYMELGMGRVGKYMGVAFAVFGLIGCLPLFTANQLTEVLRYLVITPMGFGEEVRLYVDLSVGFGLVALVALVILGGIKRIGEVTGYLFPVMVGVYMLMAFWILGTNVGKIPAMFALIFTDAFSAQAVQGGTLGALIIIGVRRAAFSNEAGIGTSPMMHGAAKTNQPIREGLVAMLGPFVDTIIICTITALIITMSGVWQLGKSQGGIHLTALALDQLLPHVGRWLLLFSYSYYGLKCFTYLFGLKYKKAYLYFYLASIVFGAVSSVSLVVDLIDLLYALMVLVNMPAVFYLAPKVKEALQNYRRDAS
jgi:alanine or glycine:cation symporter, AGCS family